jgi:polar amino acid transport system substrate-binding protein
MVGFNRRFSPLVQRMKMILDQRNPVSVNYRINAGNIPLRHWIQDPETGGGRILGEVCHFVDLALFICGSPPVSVYACMLKGNLDTRDTLNISLACQNGSIAVISYFANGSPAMSKERLEVFAAGTGAVIEDFKVLTVYTNRKKVTRRFTQDKGHRKEIETFLLSVKENSPSPIPFREVYVTTRVGFDIVKSIEENRNITY